MKKNVTFLISLIALISSCHWYGPPPGKGKKAEKFYEKAIPIIEALDRYYEVNKVYPASLDNLVPEYINKINWPKRSYKSSEKSFELWFTYEGPGVNSCVYRPGKNWECSGLI